MPTVTQILNAFPTACVLAGNDVAKSSLNGKRLDNDLPKKMYAVYFVLKKIYSINPNFTGVTAAANYLWELMGRYGIQALNYIATAIVTPPVPVTASTRTYLIPIRGTSFSDATNYNNPLIIGKSLAIYWNDISRFLLPTEFTLTSTGVNIIAEGFDAVANPTYDLFIYIIDPSYLVNVFGSDFTDATHYNNSGIVGKSLSIYWNDISRFLYPTEFALTPTGVNITAAGFDAVSNPSYELYIFII